MSRKREFSREGWIDLASNLLAPYAKKRIADEINAHYRAAVEQELERGKSESEAHEYAMVSLGSPYKALKEFRKTYLTREQDDTIKKWFAQVTTGLPPYFTWLLIAVTLFYILYFGTPVAVSACFGFLWYCLFYFALPRATKYFLSKKKFQLAFANPMLFFCMVWPITLFALGRPEKLVSDILGLLIILAPAVWINYRFVRRIPADYEWKKRVSRHV